MEIEAKTWQKINQYLETLESAMDHATLLRVAAAGVMDLVPNDIGIGIIDPSLKIVHGYGVSSSLINLYNERFNRLLPNLEWETPSRQVLPPDRTRWADYPKSEFYNDFARPYGIGYGMAVVRPYLSFSLMVERSPHGQGFSDVENLILEVINRHLNHFISIREKLDLLSPSIQITEYDIRFCFPQLSLREAQVALRLCLGFKAREIASALKIGVRTVEAHINHLYFKLDVLNRQGAIAAIQARLNHNFSV